MMVMPANNAGTTMKHIAESWPGRIGWIMSPEGWRKPWLPYALDNGAFPVWARGGRWDEGGFYALCEKTKLVFKPLWIAVPDVVADGEATIRSWWRHCARVAAFGAELAFVVQDGMSPDDVPGNAAVIFVGGTREWKWRNLRLWTQHFPRVHVGRVNTERMLWMAHEAGVESCDGTGWFRGRKEQLDGLLRYLEESTIGGRPHRTDVERGQGLLDHWGNECEGMCGV
jgi:hypothetical protein